MVTDREAAFEAVQWPSAFSTIVSMSLNYSKLLNLSVTCWEYSGPTVSLFVCDTAFTLCPSHALVLHPGAFSLILSTWGCQSSFSWSVFLLQSCKRLALLHPPSPQLLPARPDSQLTASQAVPRTSGFAMVNHMHWWNLIEAVFSLFPHSPMGNCPQRKSWWESTEMQYLVALALCYRT